MPKKGILYCYFGKLFVIEELPTRKIVCNSTNKIRYYKVYLCKCECGKTIEALKSNLLSGQKGCKECSRKTHGYIKHPLYKTWKGMLYRCGNKRNKEYKNYGGRGIKVCEEWKGPLGIIEFIKWNESLPLDKRKRFKLQLDRIDNNGDYTPANCHWTTSRKNTNNRNCTTFCYYKGQKIAFGDFYLKYSKGERSYSNSRYWLLKGLDPMSAIGKKIMG